MTFIDSFLEIVKSVINRNQIKYDKIVAECGNWKNIADQQIDDEIERIKSDILKIAKKGMPDAYVSVKLELWMDTKICTYKEICEFVDPRIESAMRKTFEPDSFELKIMKSDYPIFFNKSCFNEEKFLHMKKFVYFHTSRISWRFDQPPVCN